MLPGTRVPAHDAHEADVLHLGPVAAPVARPVAGAARGPRARPIQSVAAAQGPHSCPGATRSSATASHVQCCARVAVVRVVLVQVQGVVVRVPRRHQVTGGKGGGGGGREAGGGGAALIWKDV